MTQDARFEDGSDRPLRLKALDEDDLNVLSSLVQDAVCPASEMTWRAKEMRFALLLNRFRWEDAPRAEARKRAFERVQSVLVIENALKVRSQGIPRGDEDTVLSLLSIEWTAGEDGTGVLTLNLAGDGAVAVDVEALEVVLKDVTRPYVAPSHKIPHHPE